MELKPFDWPDFKNYKTLKAKQKHREKGKKLLSSFI